MPDDRPGKNYKFYRQSFVVFLQIEIGGGGHIW